MSPSIYLGQYFTRKTALRKFWPSCFTSRYPQSSVWAWYLLCGLQFASHLIRTVLRTFWPLFFYKPASAVICLNVISTPWSAYRVLTAPFNFINTLRTRGMAPLVLRRQEQAQRHGSLHSDQSNLPRPLFRIKSPREIITIRLGN